MRAGGLAISLDSVSLCATPSTRMLSALSTVFERKHTDRGAVVEVTVDDDTILNERGGKGSTGSMGGSGVGSSTTPLVVVGSIDQGSERTAFLLVTRTGQIVASARMELEPVAALPEDLEEWHEQNPLELWNTTVTCMLAIQRALNERNITLCSVNDQRAKRKSNWVLAGIGIANQRETLIAWNKITGKPYYNAIVWDDRRAAPYFQEWDDEHISVLHETTGLSLYTTAVGPKVRWLLEHVSELQSHFIDADTRGQIAFGTVDSWLIYQLTGQPSPIAQEGAANAGGIFVTDVTNASRWLCMNLHTGSWDPILVDIVCGHHHDIPIETAFPLICPSSHIYGLCHGRCGVDFLDQVPVAAAMADSQATLFGQTAFHLGEAKNTYADGCCLVINTGTSPVFSASGLVTMIAYQIGQEGTICYALEGRTDKSEDSLIWLRDNLHLINSQSEAESLALTVKDNDGLYFVSGFSRKPFIHDAACRTDKRRASLLGISASHHNGHLCRAALEMKAYQTKEFIDAVAADVKISSLRVDGHGIDNSKFLMQFQADIIQIPLMKPFFFKDVTAMGAAFAAGLAVAVWKDLDEIRAIRSVAESWEPKMEQEKRDLYWNEWRRINHRKLELGDDSSFEQSVGNASSILDDEICQLTPLSIAFVHFAVFTFGFIIGRRSRQ